MTRQIIMIIKKKGKKKFKNKKTVGIKRMFKG